MTTLIIYGHPNTKGHCSLILNRVKRELRKKKIEYEVIDLYKINYDPVLHENEHYTAGNREVSRQNREFQKKIKESDHLIFIYPVWWSSQPAILKGFLDRVLVSGYGFKYINSVPRGLLKGKKATVFMTSGGPMIYYMLTLNPVKRNIRQILNFCGVKTKTVQFYSCRKLDEKKERLISRKVLKSLEKL